MSDSPVTIDPDSALAQLIEYEKSISGRFSFEPLIVPGLLQTEEYARAVISATVRGASGEHVNTLTETRMRRQELFDRPDQPQLFFVLDEAVLWRTTGNEKLMKRQLAKILEVAQKPYVTIEVLPLNANIHAGVTGAFTILEFPNEHDVLYTEGPLGELIARDYPDSTYRDIFAELRLRSLPLTYFFPAHIPAPRGYTGETL